MGGEAESLTEKSIHESPLLTVGSSPHIRSPLTTRRIMWTVNGSLMPGVLAGIWFFGPRALLLVLVSVLTCVLIEAASQRIFHRKVRVMDGSAVITGLLLAMVSPPGLPLWAIPLGALAAIFITKELVGGLGFNIFNPALIGRAFLMACFPVAMTTSWLMPGAWLPGVDAITSATPLTLLKHGGWEAVLTAYGGYGNLIVDFLIGRQPGSLGETSAMLLLAGGLFLLYQRIITWHIPAATLVSIAVLAWVFGGPEKLFTGQPLFHVLSGGAVLGAFFMATDYTTSPSTSNGKLVFGLGVGALTMLIRLKGGYPEGVCYAILLMNTVTPALERFFKPKRFALPRPAAAGGGS